MHIQRPRSTSCGLPRQWFLRRMVFQLDRHLPVDRLAIAPVTAADSLHKCNTGLISDETEAHETGSGNSAPVVFPSASDRHDSPAQLIPHILTLSPPSQLPQSSASSFFDVQQKSSYRQLSTSKRFESTGEAWEREGGPRHCGEEEEVRWQEDGQALEVRHLSGKRSPEFCPHRGQTPEGRSRSYCLQPRPDVFFPDSPNTNTAGYRPCLTNDSCFLSPDFASRKCLPASPSRSPNSASAHFLNKELRSHTDSYDIYELPTAEGLCEAKRSAAMESVSVSEGRCGEFSCQGVAGQPDDDQLSPDGTYGCFPASPPLSCHSAAQNELPAPKTNRAGRETGKKLEAAGSLVTKRCHHSEQAAGGLIIKGRLGFCLPWKEMQAIETQVMHFHSSSEIRSWLADSLFRDATARTKSDLGDGAKEGPCQKQQRRCSRVRKEQCKALPANGIGEVSKVGEEGERNGIERNVARRSVCSSVHLSDTNSDANPLDHGDIVEGTSDLYEGLEAVFKTQLGLFGVRLLHLLPWAKACLLSVEWVSEQLQSTTDWITLHTLYGL